MQKIASNSLNHSADYHPFGMIQPGRSFSSGSYRYGFQGQEKDDEIKGSGNSINYKYRMHNARIGRFFAVDPLAPEYPHNSPYAFSENRLIDGVELEGLEFSGVGKYGNDVDNLEDAEYLRYDGFFLGADGEAHGIGQFNNVTLNGVSYSAEASVHLGELYTNYSITSGNYSISNYHFTLNQYSGTNRIYFGELSGKGLQEEISYNIWSGEQYRDNQLGKRIQPSIELASGAIEMTDNPIEYFFGAGIVGLGRSLITKGVFKKTSGTVFYYGIGAEKFAYNYAYTNGFKTIQNTWYGAFGDFVSPFLSIKYKRRMWESFSAKFANSTTVEMDIVLISGRHHKSLLHTLPIDTKAAWKTTEFPILKSKNFSFKTILMN